MGLVAYLKNKIFATCRIRTWDHPRDFTVLQIFLFKNPILYVLAIFFTFHLFFLPVLCFSGMEACAKVDEGFEFNN
jgi:hypothetical protein